MGSTHNFNSFKTALRASMPRLCSRQNSPHNSKSLELTLRVPQRIASALVSQFQVARTGIASCQRQSAWRCVEYLTIPIRSKWHCENVVIQLPPLKNVSSQFQVARAGIASSVPVPALASASTHNSNSFKMALRGRSP